jgi:hypothetical protein
MEIFGIVLSLPSAFILTALYRVLLLKAASRFRWIATIFRPASYVVLGLFAAEVTLLMMFGAVRSRGLMGPIFYVGHLVVFFLGGPALANLLVLRTPSSEVPKWYVVVSLCTLFAFILVLLQYDVSEKLYGIDGNGGPYS